MSEYQCYEFAAIDKPLTARQMRELRAISTRAEITPTRFWNEYQWGDLKADPAELLASYFDAHLYFANFDTQRFMVRLPAKAVDVPLLRRYLGDRLKKVGAFVTADFWSPEESYDDDLAEAPPLAALLPIRDLLLQGDYRPAFLAWLASVQDREPDPDEVLPPVPDGLATLTPALEQLVELLRVDPRLVAAAAKYSSSPDPTALRRWVKKLSESEKTALLLRAADSPELRLGVELRSAFNRLRPKADRDVLLSQLLRDWNPRRDCDS